MDVTRKERDGGWWRGGRRRRLIFEGARRRVAVQISIRTGGATTWASGSA